jgi:Asp-tRNA(Asn)/Glu-tRNA(Gln) amidotransferase A subunit family amidase
VKDEPPMHALHTWTAQALSAAFSQRELSPLEVARGVIAQVERHEPLLRATYAFDPERALVMARESEARWLRGEPLSAIDGVPLTIKENVATRGVPTPLGSAASLLAPAAADAPPAARLREAGAVLLAKTTMPDFGMLSSGLSSFHPLTRNPWDVSRNPGGSSAGAGAAAAAGYGPLHLGTDIGGSIRLPAAWCGVVGFKPSNGRVPIQPPYLGRVAGPITRTVRDAALMMSVLSRPDARDATSLPPADIAWSDLDIDVRGLRLGVLLDAGWGQPLATETRDAVLGAAQRFGAAGAHVVPLAPFTTREIAVGIDSFWRMRSWLDIQALPDERRRQVLPFILEWVAPAAGFSAERVFHGYSQFAALRDAAVAACMHFDFVLSPVAPDVAFAAEWAMPSNQPQRAMEHIGYTLPFNASEQPAISVPCGFDAAGLPVGLQIIGRRHDDLGVLRMARAWEQLRPELQPWPLDDA